MQALEHSLPVSAWGCCACRYQCHRPSSSKKNQRQPPFHQNKGRKGVFTKPSPPPTPLLRHGPQTVTRLQMLNETIKDVLDSMERGVHVGPDIFSSLLETCSQMGALQQGVQVHRLIPPRFICKTASLSAKLVRFYAVCGRLDDAHRLFDEIAKPASVFAWNSLISGYVEQRQYEDAMALYYQMDETGVEPDNFTFPRVLKACAGIGSLQRGEDVHRHIIRCGYGGDQFITNALIDMYAKCGEIVKARYLFERMRERDIISWNTMLIGYIRHGCLDYAVNVIRLMVADGFELDSVGISAMLAGCASSSCRHGLKMGTQIHSRVIRQSNELDLSVSNSLIDMYSKLGSTSRARTVFNHLREKDIVSWNAIISAYGRKDADQAFAMFKSMVESGIIPDSITFVALLSACVSQAASSRCLVDEGWNFFNLMHEKYGIQPCVEHYACMVNLLGRAGFIDEAYNLITEQMQPPLEPGPSIWGALLFACSVHGHVDVGEIAAEILFELEPDNVENFNLLLQIYSGAQRWDDAQRVREMIRERGL